MKKNKAGILADVAEYYSDKLAQNGETPQGVDWNGGVSQVLRFSQLCKLIDASDSFSVNDIGCGYGALFEYLVEHYAEVKYTGIDVSEDMVNAAVSRYGNRENVNFIAANEPDDIADYGIASGIFNVRLGRSDTEWQDYLEGTLDLIDKSSKKGFAFNCLTSYSDQEKMRDYLYYADPCRLFDFCKRRYSRNVSVLHDYDLYEFTILVRK